MPHSSPSQRPCTSKGCHAEGDLVRSASLGDDIALTIVQVEALPPGPAGQPNARHRHPLALLAVKLM